MTVYWCVFGLTVVAMLLGYLRGEWHKTSRTFDAAPGPVSGEFVGPIDVWFALDEQGPQQ
jgi:hypothetical protein